MRIKYFQTGLLLALIALSPLSCGQGTGEATSPADGKPCARIVSLAPNITETLFALGLGDRVAGVTEFCAYPPEARRKPKVGGFLDINYEALAALHPDLVILLPSHGEARKRLAALGIGTLTVRNGVVGEILGSIDTIGKTCGVPGRADSLTRDIRARMAAIRGRTENLAKPRVLIVVDRTAGRGKPGTVCVAGPETFYDELVTLAGGENAYRGPKIPYPEVSSEGIIRLNPEVIVDILPALATQGIPPGAARADWMTLEGVRAVRTGRVHVLTEGYAVVPGPRFIQTLEKFAELIHPEASGIHAGGAQ